jgi:parvulin-like peptidyl-prolyl isomerase
MDENRRPEDTQEKEVQIPEKIEGDIEQLNEVTIEDQPGKEVTSGDDFNHTANIETLNDEPVVAEEKTEITLMQDLFGALGIGFSKNRKKSSSINNSDNEADELGMQADKTSPQQNINEVQEESLTEQQEIISEDYQPIMADDNRGITAGTTDEEGILDDSEASKPVNDAPVPTKKRSKRKLIFVPVILLAAFLGFRLYAFITEPRPPSEDVVASYSGKNLTKAELLAYIKSKGYKTMEHGYCETHGLDHAKCDQTEACETHPVHSLEAYQQIIKKIALQKIIDDWAKENGLTQRNEVKHDFKHLVEEVSLDKLMEKVHKDELSPDKIDKLAVKNYYDANIDKYKDKNFSEVEDEIRDILAAQKDEQFFPQYIEKLKKNAGLSVNYELLKMDNQYELRKTEALFTIHGKKFTLGEFQEEFKELSPEIQAKFARFEAKKSLVDELIAKELLLEETGDDTADPEDSKVVEEMKIQYLAQILHKEEIDAKIADVTDEEINQFYEEKKDLLVEPPKSQISLIRVAQGASDAEKARARQRIDEALQKLKGGADFAATAKEYSTDSTASMGGEIKEWIYDDNHLDPELRINIFQLQPNDISNVFEYEGGYFIVKVRQKEDKRPKTFDEVKEQIKGALMDEKHHKREAELGDELLKKSQLVIYNSSLRQMLNDVKIDQ